MYTRLISFSRTLYLAGVVLALLLLVPVTWFPMQLGKVSVFASLLALLCLLFVVGGGGRELLRAHGWRAALFVGLLPLLYFLSSLFSANTLVSFAGTGVDTDTVAFTILAFLAFVLAFVLFRTLRTVKLLLGVVFFTLVGAVVFQLIVILFGNSVVPFDVFQDRSVNLIGKWNDLGLVAGLLITFLISYVGFTSVSTLQRSVLGGIALVLIFLLAVVNFNFVWALLLVFSIALALLGFFLDRERGASRDDYLSLPPLAVWLGGGVAALSLAFLFFGTSINTSISNIFPVSSLEVRPSYSSTLGVMNAAQQGSLLRVAVGTGPNTFVENWIMHKPTEVNQSLFWNLDFSVGFSTLLTALGTVGIVGMLAWLVPLILVLIALVRAVRLQVLSREERLAAILLGVGSIFLMVATILYVPSQNMILLGFILSGAAFGFLWRQGRSQDHEAGVTRSRALAGMVVAIALLALSFTAAGAADRRFLAQAYAGKGVVALQQGDTDTAIVRAQRSYNLHKSPEALILMASAGTAKMQQLAQATSTPAETLQQQFTSVAGATIQVGQEAVATFPRDYRSHLALGRAYDLLSQVQVEGAYEQARQSYQNATVQNPNNPQIPLMLARLAAAEGNRALAGQELAKSLTLKPNYTDAILFDVQLRVADNDLPNAIRSATAAVQTAPGVAPIWFELGLLYYASNDTKSAIQPLENAISIVPDYANAKYFLGLSYYAQKRTNEALALFQDLAQTNPTNQEVRLVISNMAAGKDPFASSTPPAIPPEERETAPIAQ